MGICVEILGRLLSHYKIVIPSSYHEPVHPVSFWWVFNSFSRLLLKSKI